jgi:hypothetical protein
MKIWVPLYNDGHTVLINKLPPTEEQMNIEGKLIQDSSVPCSSVQDFRLWRIPYPFFLGASLFSLYRISGVPSFLVGPAAGAAVFPLFSL